MKRTGIFILLMWIIIIFNTPIILSQIDVSLEHDQSQEVPFEIKPYEYNHPKVYPVSLNARFFYDQIDEKINVRITSNSHSHYDYIWIPTDVNQFHLDRRSSFKRLFRSYSHKIKFSRHFRKQIRMYRFTRFLEFIDCDPKEPCSNIDITSTRSQYDSDLPYSKMFKLNELELLLDFKIDKNLSSFTIYFDNFIPVKYSHSFALPNIKLQYLTNQIRFDIKIERDHCLNERSNITEIESKIVALKRHYNDIEGYKDKHDGNNCNSLQKRVIDDNKPINRMSNCSKLNNLYSDYNSKINKIRNFDCTTDPCKSPEIAQKLKDVENAFGVIREHRRLIKNARKSNNKVEFKRLKSRDILKEFDDSIDNFGKYEFNDCKELKDSIIAYVSFFNRMTSMQFEEAPSRRQCSININEITEATASINNLVNQRINTGADNSNDFSEVKDRVNRLWSGTPERCKTNEIKQAFENFQAAVKMYETVSNGSTQ
jgi:hypothetical protein